MISIREKLQVEQENVLKYHVAKLEKEKQKIENEKQKLAFEKQNLDQIVKDRVAKRIAIQRQAEVMGDSIESPDKSEDFIEKLHGL